MVRTSDRNERLPGQSNCAANETLKPWNRVYRRLFAAQVIALVGTGMMTIALGLLAFKIAGD
jgi:hypothetical protein